VEKCGNRVIKYIAPSTATLVAAYYIYGSQSCWYVSFSYSNFRTHYLLLAA